MILLVAGLYSLASCMVWLERSIVAYVNHRAVPQWNALFRPFQDGFCILWQGRLEATVESRWRTRIGPVFYLALATFAFVTIPFGYVMPLSVDRGPLVLEIAPGMDVGLLGTLAAFFFSALYLVHFGAGTDEALRGERWIADQLPMGLSLLAIVSLCGSTRLETIILSQAATETWCCGVQPVAAAIFICAAAANPARTALQANPTSDEKIEIQDAHCLQRNPREFAEYLHSIAMAYLFVIVFLGGWHLWGLTPFVSAADVTVWGALARMAVLHVKVGLVIVGTTWISCTSLRIRVHRLREKLRTHLVPLGAVNLGLIAVTTVLQTDERESMSVLAAASWGLFGLWLIAVAARTHSGTEHEPA